MLTTHFTMFIPVKAN